MRGVTRIKKKGGGSYRRFSSIANIVFSRGPTPICTRILSTMRWQVPRRIEMRETRGGKKKKKKERKRGREEGKGMEQKEQKGSPSIMATTLRSELRAPKSRPVSMPRHRHSFERRCVMRVSTVLCGHGAASLRLASASLRSPAAATTHSHGTAGRNFAGG